MLSYLYGKENKALVKDNSTIKNSREIIEFSTNDLQMINNKIRTVELAIEQIWIFTIDAYVGTDIAKWSLVIIVSIALWTTETIISGIVAAMLAILQRGALPIIMAYVLVSALKYFNYLKYFDFLLKEKKKKKTNGIYLVTERINKILDDKLLEFIVKFIEKNYKTISNDLYTHGGVSELNIEYDLEGNINLAQSYIQLYETTLNYTGHSSCMRNEFREKIFFESKDDLKNKIFIYFETPYSKALGVYNLLKYYYQLKEKNLIVENGEIKRKQNMEIVYLKYGNLSVYLGKTYIPQYKPYIKREKRLGEILKMSEYIDFIECSSQGAISYSADKNKATGIDSGEMYSKKDKERIENAKTVQERNELINQTKIDISEIDAVNIFDDEYRFFPFLNGDDLTDKINNNFYTRATAKKVEETLK